MKPKARKDEQLRILHIWTGAGRDAGEAFCAWINTLGPSGHNIRHFFEVFFAICCFCLPPAEITSTLALLTWCFLRREEPGIFSLVYSLEKVPIFMSEDLNRKRVSRIGRGGGPCARAKMLTVLKADPNLDGRSTEGLSDAQFAREAARLLKFQRGDAAKLPASTASKRLEKCLLDAGIQAMYKPFDGIISFSGKDGSLVMELPEYAWRKADSGTQDSELIAESLRFVANFGYGKNRIADAVARDFGG